jgi:DNA repair protein RadC
MDADEKKMSIKQWAEEDRPREKMLLKGKTALSDAELLAILISTGTKEFSAVELGKIILKKANNNLIDLARFTIEDFKKIKGIGEAKAISIAAALELGRRRSAEMPEQKPLLNSSKEAAQFIQPLLADETIEKFYLLYLNRSGRLLNVECISSGGVSGTVVDPKVIFKKAIENNAVSIILCHNHPSGNLKPSQADIDITKKLFKAGELIDIAVHDHLIVANTGYFSFADEGLIR